MENENAIETLEKLIPDINNYMDMHEFQKESLLLALAALREKAANDKLREQERKVSESDDPDCAKTIENWLIDFENKNGKGISREYVTEASDRLGIYAVCENKLIGGLTFRVEKDWIFLRCGYILPEYRGQGLYSAFIRRLEKLAAEHNLSGIFVSTYTFEAPHIYEHMGFTKGAVLENLPKGNTNIDYYKPMKARGTQK